MKTLYACTHVAKDVEIDNFERGCDPATRACIMAERMNVTSGTLPGLLEAIAERLGLDLDDVWVPEETLTYIGYNRLENGDGDEPTKEAQRRWKKGKETLYLADYYFAIERRTVEPVSREEFAGIKHHE
jgi:hypothetical protein